MNAVTDRHQSLDVSIDETGTASHTLKLEWANNILTPGNSPFRDLPVEGPLRVLGNYVRVLVPAGSSFLSVSGGTLAQLTGLEEINRANGRDVFGNYVEIPPGSTTVASGWTSAGVVATSGNDRVYQLTIQKEPGTRAEAIAVKVNLPPGATVLKPPAT